MICWLSLGRWLEGGWLFNISLLIRAVQRPLEGQVLKYKRGT